MFWPNDQIFEKKSLYLVFKSDSVSEESLFRLQNYHVFYPMFFLQYSFAHAVASRAFSSFLIGPFLVY